MRTTIWSKWNTKDPKFWGFQSSVHVDMGCGHHPRNPFNADKLIGVDIIPVSELPINQHVKYVQILSSGEIPLPDGSVDSISGFDFLEHLSRGNGSSQNEFIGFMNEAHRLLRPGGVLFLVTPAFPSPAAFQDPTHVNFITSETVKYFLGPTALAQSMGYGFKGSFNLIYQCWMGPFSKIFNSSCDSVSGKSYESLRNFLSFDSMRRMISTVRQPTHLVWILTKSP
jgi:SAM-dependent methyltransferase